MQDIKLGDKIGRYKIQQLLGAGGLGNVYCATDTELNRRVAIKVNRNSRLESAINNEALILSSLQHPSIITVFDLQRRFDKLFLVLEYMESGTLKDSLRETKTAMPQRRIVEIIVNLAEALDYLHRRGYIHRNIKPGAILLDSNGFPRLSSFGVAVHKKNLTINNSNWGTRKYIAPEQRDGNHELISPQTDIWVLGVTLCESLTGQDPDKRDQLETSTISRDQLETSTISEELKRICWKCLSVNPIDRYRNAEALASDLRLYLYSKKSQEQSRVFISHSTKDREFVELHIVNYLEKHNIKTWYSKVEIQTASEWERSILLGLESCEWYLIVMSQHSVKSEWVKDELIWAIDNRPENLVPVMIEDCEPEDFHIRLRRIQFADLRQPSKESLFNLLKTFTI